MQMFIIISYDLSIMWALWMCCQHDVYETCDEVTEPRECSRVDMIVNKAYVKVLHDTVLYDVLLN